MSIAEVNKLLKMIDTFSTKLQGEAKKTFLVGDKIRWSHHGSMQSGVVLDCWSNGDDVQLEVLNSRTGKKVVIRYGLYTGLYS